MSDPEVKTPSPPLPYPPWQLLAWLLLPIVTGFAGFRWGGEQEARLAQDEFEARQLERYLSFDTNEIWKRRVAASYFVASYKQKGDLDRLGWAEAQLDDLNNEIGRNRAYVVRVAELNETKAMLQERIDASVHSHLSPDPTWVHGLADIDHELAQISAEIGLDRFLKAGAAPQDPAEVSTKNSQTAANRHGRVEGRRRDIQVRELDESAPTPKPQSEEAPRRAGIDDRVDHTITFSGQIYSFDDMTFECAVPFFNSCTSPCRSAIKNSSFDNSCFRCLKKNCTEI